MEPPKQHIIKRIAQELDCGCHCYYNFKTDAIIGIPNRSDFFDEELFNEAFGDSLDLIKKQQTDFIKIEALENFESFKIMERFVAQVTDVKLKAELEAILTNKKPFQHFKHKIDHSEFRQHWFEFKQNELEKIVATQLNNRKAN